MERFLGRSHATFLNTYLLLSSLAVFVDNSRDFLLNFVLQLDEGLAYRVFDSPFEALDCIKQKRCELELLSERCSQ
ncbi:hypothetical protein PGH43_17440 [Legionella pneumophila 130b]|nr:hypothetical protein PGH43_17440 [Legionella pneumophila 130b]